MVQSYRRSILGTGRYALAALSLIAVLVLSAGAPRSTAEAGKAPTIVGIAQGNPEFSTLVTALQAAGLVDTLMAAGPYTVLAPTNAAFAALPPGTLDALVRNPEQLRAILTYHVVAGRVPASQVVTLSSAETVQGEPISIRVSGGSVILNGTSRVVQTDIQADNGIIHVIDSLLIPPSLAGQ